MPKVSVIIPTYNCAKYLSGAIDSILVQTFQDFEIIIVDDGSTDGTKELLNEYLTKNNSKIKYVYQDNHGLACARNAGIKHAKGEHIALLDADDEWLPNRLEEGIKIMESYKKVALVHANITFISESGNIISTPRRKKRVLSGNIFKALFLREAHISCPTVLIRKECINKVGIFDEQLSRLGCEDRELWLRVAKEYNIAYIDKVLAYYRIRSGSMSKDISKMLKARYYVLDKFFPNTDYKYGLRRLALAKIHRDAGDQLLSESRFKESREHYFKALSFKFLSFWVWINLIKGISRVKIEMFPNIRADAKRYTGNPKGIEKIKSIIRLLFTQEFMAIVIFRFGKSVKRIKIPFIGFVLRVIYFLLNKIIAEICASILIDLDSEIGKGFQIGHFGGTHIKAKIGENCTVGQFVVIGHKGAFSGGGVPALGNNVWVGAGAKIFGDVKIGDNVFIGANAVVVNDIPDNATAVGIPARVVKIKKMNSDGER